MRTGVIAVVHPQQTNQLEGNGAHRHQRTKVHRTGQETLRQTALIQASEPGFTDDSQRQLIYQTYRLTGLQPGFTKLFQLGKQVVVMFITGFEEQLHKRLESLPPLFGLSRLCELLMGELQSIEQRDQRPDQCGIQAADFIIRFNP